MSRASSQLNLKSSGLIAKMLRYAALAATAGALVAPAVPMGQRAPALRAEVSSVERVYSVEESNDISKDSRKEVPG